MAKMVVFDIDGTLLNFHEHKLHARIKNMFKRLKAKGIYVCLATGRDFVSIADIYDDPNIDYFIGANGSFIYDVQKKKYIFNSPIKYDDYENFYKDVLLTNQSSITNVILSDDQNVYVWENKQLDGPWFWSPFKDKFRNYEFSKNQIKHESFHLVTINFDSKSNLLEKAQTYFKENKTSLYVQAYWHNGFFVANYPINKAYTVKLLANKLNIDIKDIIAFGDGENDIQMIREVGIGVAMGNANQYLKEIANDVTTSVEDFGTIHYLEKRGII